MQKVKCILIRLTAGLEQESNLAKYYSARAFFLAATNAPIEMC